ncbi:non-ribosomal peptide synthetase [Streptomyces albidoflavus]|uniref:non-ribosomal peptide synthetase n=1 Tax=Streptomyces albidoflavus TaxID=1886 RepID=UPI0033F80A77
MLLHYADGARDLVLVADRHRLPLGTLRQIADLATDPASHPDLVTAPAAPGRAGDFPAPSEAGPVTALPALARVDWGLPDLATPPGHTHRFALNFPVGSALDAELLTAALAFTAGWYGREETVEVGVLDSAGPPSPVILTFKTHEDQSVTDLITQAGPSHRRPTGKPISPATGVVLTEDHDRRYEPSLTCPFPLTLHLGRAADGTLSVECRIVESTVSRRIAEQFCAHLVRTAVGFAGAPSRSTLADMRPSAGPWANAVLAAGGLGDVPEVRGTIHENFARVARTRPDATALVAGGTRLTYRELNERAEASAAALRARGVAPGDLVGVCLERDADLIVTLLAVLKTGAAYLPMDVGHPAERLRYTVEDAGPAVVVTTLKGFPKETDAVLVDLAELASGPTVPPPPSAGGHEADSAYVIYTSGSTGRPKGVVVPHRNVLALVDATAEDFELGPDDTWTLFHSSAFDFSVWEIWGCLLTGGRLVVVPHWVTRDADAFCALLSAESVTVLNQTPSAFSQLILAEKRDGRELVLRLVILGGEPLDIGMLTPWFIRYPPSHCRMVNMFGITETTVHVSAHTVTPQDVATGSRSVGRALPGWHLSVRDDAGRLLPPGAAGELYVGGAGVADRYLARPDLTAERFVDDPLTGERVYRSGDLGRLRVDGNFDHLGRLDTQVKVRGYRIELDEIRAVLLSVADVTAAAVVVCQDDPADPADRRIIAYVTANGLVDVAEVRSRAETLLVDYMIPSAIVQIESIPLTVNGKLDLDRLPDPRLALDAKPEAQTATTKTDPLGDRVLAVWSALLKTEVRLEDNFFKLGGNSLLVIRIIAALRAENLPKVTVKQFYGHATARQFISLIHRLATEQPATP